MHDELFHDHGLSSSTECFPLTVGARRGRNSRAALLGKNRASASRVFRCIAGRGTGTIM